MKVHIAGCGLAGVTAAIVLKEQGHRVEVFETRRHIGGNCYDAMRDGVRVHQYGPHGFHTNNAQVWEFLNRYTRFNDVCLRVVANTAEGQIPIPFNDTSAALIGDKTPEQIRDLLFIDYSEKQWGVPWSALPRHITARVPKRRVGTDDRYHTDRYQGIPEQGYTAMFEAMLEGIPVHLNAGPLDYKSTPCDLIVFTGPIDTYFEHCFGPLGYRSLRFVHKRAPRRSIMQLNECNREQRYTRTVDHSHWHRQDVEQTVLTTEYPCEYDGTNVPYYPKPFGAEPERYRLYKGLADKERDTLFLGRLATYNYLDMDDTVAQVLSRLKVGELVTAC